MKILHYKGENVLAVMVVMVVITHTIEIREIMKKHLLVIHLVKKHIHIENLIDKTIIPKVVDRLQEDVLDQNMSLEVVKIQVI